jgi:hypothetical protein
MLPRIIIYDHSFWFLFDFSIHQRITLPLPILLLYYYLLLYSITSTGKERARLSEVRRGLVGCLFGSFAERRRVIQIAIVLMEMEREAAHNYVGNLKVQQEG